MYRTKGRELDPDPDLDLDLDLDLDPDKEAYATVPSAHFSQSITDFNPSLESLRGYTAFLTPEGIVLGEELIPFLHPLPVDPQDVTLYPTGSGILVQCQTPFCLWAPGIPIHPEWPRRLIRGQLHPLVRYLLTRMVEL